MSCWPILWKDDQATQTEPLPGLWRDSSGRPAGSRLYSVCACKEGVRGAWVLETQRRGTKGHLVSLRKETLGRVRNGCPSGQRAEDHVWVLPTSALSVAVSSICI